MTLRLSEMLEDMRPVWESFIEDLGYSSDKAGRFVEGYEKKLKTLPTTEKLRALERIHPDCMTAGFDNANIDEDEALQRYQNS